MCYHTVLEAACLVQTSLERLGKVELCGGLAIKFSLNLLIFIPHHTLYQILEIPPFFIFSLFQQKTWNCSVHLLISLKTYSQMRVHDLWSRKVKICLAAQCVCFKICCAWPNTSVLYTVWILHSWLRESWLCINKIQRDATVCRCLFTENLLYMFRVPIATIIRSTSNCNCSFWYRS